MGIPCVAIVLAAGKGTRMGSDLAKVLHPFLGSPLGTYPIRRALEAGAERVVVVVGHQADTVQSRLREPFDEARGQRLSFALQAEQHGTGHAVSCGLPELPEEESVVWILSGDVPLIRTRSLVALRDACLASAVGLALATFEPEDPTGYGRILRDASGRITGIREERDADASERAVRECNAGIYAVRASALREVIPTLGRDNEQGEMYLTDIVHRLAPRGSVLGLDIDPREAAGVNTPQQLAALESLGREQGGLS